MDVSNMPCIHQCLDSDYPNKLSIYRCALLSETLNKVLAAMHPLPKVGSFSHLVIYLVLMEELEKLTYTDLHGSINYGS